MSDTSIQIITLPPDELTRRLAHVRSVMASEGIECALLRSCSNIFYMTGRVFSGYIAISPDRFVCLVRRPSVLAGPCVEHFHSMKELVAMLKPLATNGLAFELDSLPWATVERLCSDLGIRPTGNASKAMRVARSVKTDWEVERIRQSAQRQTVVYENVGSLYSPGMTDIQLQIEIERLSRLEGCLGQFRVAGDEMDIFMGNVLTGENADTPSPFDFAMGGAGISPSLPVGANGTPIRPGMPVMVDMNGNFNGYMSDMTRCYSDGPVPAEVERAHQVSIDICRELAAMGRPGVEAHLLYDRARQMADEAGLLDNFMGMTSQAGFVGHGIAIDVNEAPVLAPRSRDVLQAGNVIAIEPKFVLPHLGAIGIENTYVVRDHGMECLTLAHEIIMPLQ